MPLHRTTICCRFFAPTVALLALFAVGSVVLAAPETTSQILLPALRWQVDIAAAPAVQPLLSGGYVFLSLKPGVVSALRVKDGIEAWTAKLTADQEPASDAHLVLVPAGEAIHALHADTGREAWLAATGTVTAPLLVQSGWLIAASGGMLSALRASDGSQVWTIQAGEIRERPTIDGDALFVSFADGRIASFDLPTGVLRWEHKIAGAPRQPFVHGDRVYVGSDDKHFYALRIKNGEEDWNVFVGAAVVGAAAVDREHVYFAAMDNLLRALDRISGNQRWRQELAFRPVTGPSVIGDSVLVPGASDALQFFAGTNGRRLKEIKLDATLAIPPGVGTEPGETVASVAAITGGLADRWKLWLYGPLPPAPPGLPVEPLSVLPGLSVPLGT